MIHKGVYRRAPASRGPLTINLRSTEEYWAVKIFSGLLSLWPLCFKVQLIFILSKYGFKDTSHKSGCFETKYCKSQHLVLKQLIGSVVCFTVYLSF